MRTSYGSGAVRAAVAALLLAAAATAAPAEWRRTETEHFLIVYEQQDQASANELASICEDVYAKVTGFFRSYPEKVPVVIRGRLDYANGMAAPFPWRLELIVTAPSWPDIGSRSESWLRSLLTHELVHYVHLGMERGFLHVLARVFGGEVRQGSAVFLPGWMIEGPATNLETTLTSGGRGRNPFFELQYKAPIVEGDFFSLAQASYSSAFPPLGRIYVAGYVIVDHLLRTYGEDSFTRIMDDYLAFPFFGPWAAIRRVTGKKAQAVFEDMKTDLEQRYRAAAAVAGGNRVSPDRIGDWQHPVPTARGLYASRWDLEQHPAIVRVDPDNGTEEVVAALGLTDPSSFTATADGGTLYAASFFADWRPTDGERVDSDLSVIDAASGTVRRITTAAHLWHPAVSADGRHLVAVQGSGPYTRLVEVDPQAGSTRVLFSVAGASVFNPAIAPDGTRIALVINRGGIQDVVVIGYAEALAGSRGQDDPHAPVEDVNSGLATYVAGPDAYGEYFPTWNGSDLLLFSSDRSGSLVLYEADLATGGTVLVHEDSVGAYEGFVDGENLIYTSYSSKGFCLKRAPFAPSRGGAAAVVPGPAEPLLAQGPFTAVESTPYRDPSRPYLWYPLVTLGSGNPAGWDVGVGAEVLAGSLLGTSSWSLGAAWHPLTSQPEISLALSHGFGSATVAAGAAAGDDVEGSSHVLASNVRLGVSVPLVSESAYDRGVSLSTRAGVSFVSQTADVSPFTFADVLEGSTDSWEHRLLLDAGIGFAWARSGGAVDFVAPRLARFSAGGEVMLPALDGSTGARFTLLGQAGIPVIWQHLVLRAGVKAAYGIATLDSSSESFATPRGWFDAEVRPQPGRLLASLDLLAPIGLFDQPLLFGVGLLGMSAGLHVEAAADWDFGPAGFQIPWICAGAEITFQFGAVNLDLPVGIGLAARFDPTGIRPFDITSDLRPYLFLSFDSFRDAWTMGGTGTRVRLEQP